MLFNLLQGGDMTQIVLTLLTTAFVVVAILPIHECAHAFVAHKLGDDTGKINGRMTLNPMRHLDPIGALSLFLVGFGWAKPVPVNPYNFKNRKAGMALTALAGPVSNLLVAFVAVLLLRINFEIARMNLDYYYGALYTVIYTFLYLLSVINIGLAAFLSRRWTARGFSAFSFQTGWRNGFTATSRLSPSSLLPWFCSPRYLIGY